MKRNTDDNTNHKGSLKPTIMQLVKAAMATNNSIEDKTTPWFGLMSSMNMNASTTQTTKMMGTQNDTQSDRADGNSSMNPVIP